MESKIGGGVGRWRVVKKPEGGYRLIAVGQLCAVWWAYREGSIRLLELQTWFGAQAVLARRCQLERGRNPRYELAELAKLVGVGEPRVLRAVARLARLRLLSWSATAIAFVADPDELELEDRAGLDAMLEEVGHHPKRPVPVPRRTLELLAGGCGRVMTATVLGHLLRCVFFSSGKVRARGYTFEGRVKASWIAAAFSVSLRGVKGARRMLVSDGWLESGESNQWALNRWGRRVSVNPAWVPSSRRARTPVSAPRSREIALASAPPNVHEKPLRELYKNQKPAERRPAGPCQANRKEKKPTLRDVSTHDLRSVPRLRELFDQATNRKWVRGSEAEFLDFVAAAAHARRVGTQNPPGLFVRVIRDGLTRFISGDDEDAASHTLKEHERLELDQFFGSEPRSMVAPMLRRGVCSS